MKMAQRCAVFSVVRFLFCCASGVFFYCKSLQVSVDLKRIVSYLKTYRNVSRNVSQNVLKPSSSMFWRFREKESVLKPSFRQILRF